MYWGQCVHNSETSRECQVNTRKKYRKERHKVNLLKIITNKFKWLENRCYRLEGNKGRSHKNTVCNIKSKNLQVKPRQNIECTEMNWKTCKPYVNINGKITGVDD